MSFYPCGPARGKLEGYKEVRRLAGAQAGDELFGLAPEEFVAARDELARRLKREGDAEAAARVKALRRPPLSAWAVNRLAREQGPALAPLLAAGERLRAATQAALAGEGADELRAASKAEHEAVAALVEAATGLLREAGHPATDATRDRVAATLHAAAASPEAAELVRHGRLTADLDPSGFGTTPDAALGEENDEYLTKRRSLRYGAPVIRVVRSGEFDRYRRRMVETGQRADGQFKVLRLTSDTSFAGEFEAERDLAGGQRAPA